MNLTIGDRNHGNPSKQLKTRYFAIVGGATLAISAIAVLSGSLKSDNVAISSAGNTSAISVTQQASFESIQDSAAREQAVLDAAVERVQPMFGTAADAEHAAQSLR
jgi:hypothetical protein